MSKRPSSDDVPISEASKKQKMQADGQPMELDNAPVALDEDLHSRQLAVYGREAFRKFQTASILVAGMNALGVEIGENTGYKLSIGLREGRPGPLLA